METYVNPLHLYIHVTTDMIPFLCSLPCSKYVHESRCLGVFSFVFITGYSQLDFSFTCIVFFGCGLTLLPLSLWVQNLNMGRSILFAPFLRGPSFPWMKILFLNLKRSPQGLSWLSWLSRTQDPAFSSSKDSALSPSSSLEPMVSPFPPWSLLTG